MKVGRARQSLTIPTSLSACHFATYLQQSHYGLFIKYLFLVPKSSYRTNYNFSVLTIMSGNYRTFYSEFFFFYYFIIGAPLHKTMVTLKSLQSMVTTIVALLQSQSK